MGTSYPDLAMPEIVSTAPNKTPFSKRPASSRSFSCYNKSMKIDPIQEVPGFGNGTDAWARWRRFLTEESYDKRQTEAVRYRNEVDKTAEKIRNDREEMQEMGKEAFAKVLNDEMNKQKRA